MKKINLHEALELYNILEDHLPNINEKIDFLSFVEAIIDSTVEKEKQEDYLKAAAILTGLDINELLQHTPKDVFDLFIEGLVENNFLDLMAFMRGLLK